MVRPLIGSVVIASLASAAPVVGSAVTVDTPVLGPAAVTTGYPMAGATNGTVSLIAWYDRRHTIDYDYTLYAARVDATGAVLDKPFVELGSVSASTSDIAVVWDGSNFVVVWPNQTGRAIVMRRVSATGVVDPAERVVHAVSGPGSELNSPTASSNGAGNALVAWIDKVSPNVVRAARVDASGAVLDPTPLSLGAPRRDTLSAAFDGTNHVVVFNTGGSPSYALSARRVSTAGVVLDAAPFSVVALGNNVVRSTIACSAASCLVAYTATGVRNEIKGVRVMGAGVLDPTPLTLLASPTQSFQEPSLSFDGSQYWVIADRAGLGAGPSVAQRLQPDGALIGTPIEVSSFLAFLTRGFVGPNAELYALDARDQLVTRVSAAGAIVGAQIIPFAASTQRLGKIAAGQGVALAVWFDDRERVLLARRFDATPAALDAVPLELARGFDLGTALDVTFDGRSFVVAYLFAGQHRLVRLSPTGAVLDVDGGVNTGLTSSARNVSIVGDGTQTWFVYDATGAQRDVMARRFSQAGVFDAVALPVANSALDEQSPSTCFDGTDVWVGWLANSFSLSRLTPTGAVAATAPPAVSNWIDGAPRLASGTPCVVLWGTTSRTVRAANLSPDAGSALVLSSVETEVPATASFNGTRWVFGAARTTPELAVSRWWNGASIDASPALVSMPLAPLSLSSASNGLGTTWLLVHRFDSTPTIQAQRLFVQVVRDLPSGQACSVAGECQSENCVDGVCCNTACAGGVMDCQACSVAAGAAVNGVCGATTGNACSDSNQCTQQDVCSAGACLGTNPVSCQPAQACQAVACVPATGACATTSVPDGAACPGGSCRGGQCVGTDGGTAGGAASVGGGSAAGGGAAGGTANVGGGSAAGGAAGGGTAGSAAAGGAAGSTAGGLTGFAGGGGTSSAPAGCGCTGAPGLLAWLALVVLSGRLSRR